MLATESAIALEEVSDPETDPGTKAGVSVEVYCALINL